MSPVPYWSLAMNDYQVKSWLHVFGVSQFPAACSPGWRLWDGPGKFFSAPASRVREDPRMSGILSQ